MFTAQILVRNVASAEKSLDFGEFKIGRVDGKFKEFRELFSSSDVNQEDWILEKMYPTLPAGPPGSPVGGIPGDLEDILLLLRLFKPGDIAFVRQAVIRPSGAAVVQYPYRAMNDLNSYSVLQFEIRPEDCAGWRLFAEGLRRCQSWGADWFSVAKRFFLYGGAQEFNPKWDEVDRILNYVTALEATLAPDKDFSRKKISERSARLITRPGEDQSVYVRLVKQLYDVRSCIVHGGKLGGGQRDWLMDNAAQVESLLRQVLVNAVQGIPSDDTERTRTLKELFEPSDEDRAEFVLQRFKEIKSSGVRDAVAQKMGECKK